MSTAQFQRIAWGAAPAATHSNSPFDPIIGDSSGAPRSATVNPAIPSPQLLQSQPTPCQTRPPASTSSQLTAPSPIPPSSGINNDQTRDKLDISPEHKQVQSKLLREADFTDWRSNAPAADPDDSDDMQKDDPFTIAKLWKHYNKSKSRVASQERMENLSWRMMSMTLKQQRERDQARYASGTLILWLFPARMGQGLTIMSFKTESTSH